MADNITTRSSLVSGNVALKQERLEHSEKSLPMALLIFAALFVPYWALFFAILYVGWPFGLVLSAIEIWFVGALFIVGHDAAHQSLTPSHRLNGIIGRLAMLPSLHSFSLWDLFHNRIHHKHNNVRGFDFVWEPMSPGDYRKAGPLGRAFYRLMRSPAGIFLYYGVALWPRKIFAVGFRQHGKFERVYLLDALLLWGFIVAQIGGAIWLGGVFGNGALESVFLAVVLPFIGWNAGMSFVIFMHHTHPEVPWYATVDEWRQGEGAIFGTAYVRFPWLTRKLMLEIMEHNAHHYAPGVPLYNLDSMQTEVRRAVTGEIVQWRFSVKELLKVNRQCKLYDYDQHRWVTFAEAGA